MLAARRAVVSAPVSARAPAQRRCGVVSFAVRAEGEEKEEEVKIAAPVTRAKETMTFGGLGASDQNLAYLDGSRPGDFGFDPLGLLDPEGAGVFVSPSWLSYAEVIHGRWAMLGTAGCMTPEILGKAGIIPEATGLEWFRSGVIPPLGSGPVDGYWCDPYTLFSVELTLMGFAEIRRLQDYRKPGSMGEQWFLGMENVSAAAGTRPTPAASSST